MRTATARDRAHQNENQSIERSQQRAISARQAEDSGSRRPRNALEAMAQRLEVTPGGLKDTLMNTVFKGCNSDAEFMMLVLVSNELDLNPMKKEIYAFPVKSGGIMPMVSIDGWIRIMNRHPQFDGIEFEYTLADDGKAVEAIESIIYCKDRKHPVKTIEFMSECVRPTDPWRTAPRRMLRHRALIQGVRIAFGITGAIAEGDEEAIEGNFREVEAKTLPSRGSLAEELDDEIPSFEQAHDPTTGEVYETDNRGMSEVDEDTARQLDDGDGTYDPVDNPTAAEGPDDSQRGDAHTGAEEMEPAYLGKVRDLRTKLGAAKTIKAVEAIDLNTWCGPLRDTVDAADSRLARSVDNDIAARKRELQQPKEA